MRPELYATPVLMGCSAYALVLAYFPAQRIPGSLGCIVATFALRAAAIHWDLVMPRFVRLPRGEGF
jgi:uncharacterized membrane protein YeiH